MWSDWDSKSSGRGVDGLQVDSQSQETSEDAVTLVVRGAEGWPEAVKEGMDLKWCLQDQWGINGEGQDEQLPCLLGWMVCRSRVKD